MALIKIQANILSVVDPQKKLWSVFNLVVNSNVDLIELMYERL